MDQDTDIDLLLGRDAADAIRAAVASGEYESPEAAIREAVEGWRRSRCERQARLRQALEEGLRSLAEGRLIDADSDDFWESIKAEARARKAG